MTTIDYAQGLRAIAGWYEAHPDIPIPHDPTIRVYNVEDTKEWALRIVEALKPCRKEWNGSFLNITHEFDGVALKFIFNRKAVCTRRIVDIREVPEEVIPAHTKEIVAWDCEPILGMPKTEEAAA